ncbi:MAG TPA: hypothetical protein VHP36_00065 [Chitinispirillaceae bacterium]|nr:hypothetical protein [Chitinispirillaceae bacterium]
MHLRASTILCLITGFALNTVALDKTLNIQFGPCWPEDLKHSIRPTALNWSIQSGMNFDNTVSLGVAFDFLWNKGSKEEQITNHIFRYELIERTLMFPVTAFLSISPLSDLIVSPRITGQVGIGFMHFTKKDVEIIGSLPTLYDENGWYFGAVYKLGMDALINLKPGVSLFSGLDHLWSKPKKIKRSDPHLFTRRNMDGWGVRFGINLFY